MFNPLGMSTVLAELTPHTTNCTIMHRFRCGANSAAARVKSHSALEMSVLRMPVVGKGLG